MLNISSAFWLKLQGDSVNLAEMIELSTRTKTFYWTSANQSIVSSGIEYQPFPGDSVEGVEESSDLGISKQTFVVANTGSILPVMAEGVALREADVSLFRVFVDTPDFGRLTYFKGKIADYSYNRQFISGNVRDLFDSINIQFPYYTYMDRCVWRFGGTGCGVNTQSITVATSLDVTSSTQQTIIVKSGTLSSSYAPGGLAFGKFTITSGVNSGEIRTVFSHSGDLLKLSHSLPFSHDAGGVLFTVYPGCKKRLVEDCKSLYNATSAFLGFPWIPKQENAY